MYLRFHMAFSITDNYIDIVLLTKINLGPIYHA